MFLALARVGCNLSDKLPAVSSIQSSGLALVGCVHWMTCRCWSRITSCIAFLPTLSLALQYQIVSGQHQSAHDPLRLEKTMGDSQTFLQSYRIIGSQLHVKNVQQLTVQTQTVVPCTKDTNLDNTGRDWLFLGLFWLKGMVYDLIQDLTMISTLWHTQTVSWEGLVPVEKDNTLYSLSPLVTRSKGAGSTWVEWTSYFRCDEWAQKFDPSCNLTKLWGCRYAKYLADGLWQRWGLRWLITAHRLLGATSTFQNCCYK